MRDTIRGALVTFFEKVQALEKRKPGLVAKAFSDHPQTPDRIVHTQEEIAKILPAKDEYTVTTSEFDDIKARLARIENKRRLTDTKDNKKPSLRRASTSDPNDYEQLRRWSADAPSARRPAKPAEPTELIRPTHQISTRSHNPLPSTNPCAPFIRSFIADEWETAPPPVPIRINFPSAENRAVLPRFSLVPRVTAPYISHRDTQ